MFESGINVGCGTPWILTATPDDRGRYVGSPNGTGCIGITAAAT